MTLCDKIEVKQRKYMDMNGIKLHVNTTKNDILNQFSDKIIATKFLEDTLECQ